MVITTKNTQNFGFDNCRNARLYRIAQIITIQHITETQTNQLVKFNNVKECMVCYENKLHIKI